MLQEEDDQPESAGQRTAEEELFPPQRIFRFLCRLVRPELFEQPNGDQHVTQGRYHEGDEQLLVQRWKDITR